MGFLMEQSLTTVIETGVGIEARHQVAEDPSTFFEEAGSEGDYNDRYVTPKSSQSFGPIWQAMNVIADDVAQLPLMAYRRLEGGGKERYPEHPADRVLHRRPNPELGPFQFKYLMISRALLWGNAYAYIERDGSGVVNLWPIEPNGFYPVRAKGELRYIEAGTNEAFRPEDILHIRGPGTDELDSPSVIKKAKITIEGGLAAEEHGTRFYTNNARPDITLEFPERVDAETAKNILKRWDRRHRGPRNAGKPGFLDHGGKVNTYSMSHKDAQWLEGKRFARTEIAGWFKIPPHKLGDLERATFSNIEHQAIEYVQGTLMPWLVRFQDEVNYKLVSASEFESGEVLFEFVVNALLRGDAKSRGEFYASGITSGWLAPNEVRKLENLNPREGLDETLRPLNMTTTVEDPDEPQPSDSDAEDGEQSARAMLLRNLCRMLANAALAAAKKPDTFIDWCDKKAPESHRGHVIEQLAACNIDQPADAADKLFEQLRQGMLAAADGSRGQFTARVKACGDNLVANSLTLLER